MVYNSQAGAPDVHQIIMPQFSNQNVKWHYIYYPSLAKINLWWLVYPLNLTVAIILTDFVWVQLRNDLQHVLHAYRAKH